MPTLTDLKAQFLKATTGKKNRVDAEMAYYTLAAAGELPGGGSFTILEADDEIPEGAPADSVFFRKEA